MVELLSLTMYMDLLLLLVAVGGSVLFLVRREVRYSELTRRTLQLSFLLISLAMVALFRAFWIGDFSYLYVFDYSATTTPALYKLTGLWAGRRGTLLLWTWTAVGTLCVEDQLQLRRRRERLRRGVISVEGVRRERGFQALVRLIGVLFTTGLAAIQLTLDPFEKIAGGRVPLEGSGLNPLLQTPWMAIHPPVTFIAFGLLTPVLGASLAYLLTREQDWIRPALRWARWGWVWMGLGLLLGGYWAYVTLGWGGYWAWDPVETSNLLPWIGLTAFLHIAPAYRKRRSYTILGPSLVALVMVLVLFESFVTRGGIWISVHAFQSFEDNSPWVRFLTVLEQDRSVLGFFLLMMAVLGATLALSLRAMLRWPVPETPRRHGLKDYLSYDTIMYGTIFSLLLVLAVTLVLMMMAVNGGIPPKTYNDRLAPLVLLMSGVFLLANLSKLTEAATSVKVAALILASSFVGAGVGSRFDGPQEGSLWLAGLALPIFVAAVGLVILQLRQLVGKPLYPYPKQATPWTVHLIHLGMVVMLAGYVATVTLEAEEQAEMKVGQTTELAGYQVTLEQMRIVRDESRPGNRLEAALVVREGDGPPGRVVPAMVDPDTTDQLISDVSILHRLDRDVYFSLDNANPSQQVGLVTVRVLPYISFVWAGAVLVIAGELVLMSLDWTWSRHWLWRMAALRPGRHPLPGSSRVPARRSSVWRSQGR